MRTPLQSIVSIETNLAEIKEQVEKPCKQITQQIKQLQYK